MGEDTQLPGTRKDPAGSDFLRRFTEYVTADGFESGAIAARLERLKFESIVGEKTVADVLQAEQ